MSIYVYVLALIKFYMPRRNIELVVLHERQDAGLLARSQYSEVPATGHLDTGFSWFPYV